MDANFYSIVSGFEQSNVSASQVGAQASFSSHSSQHESANSAGSTMVPYPYGGSMGNFSSASVVSFNSAHHVVPVQQQMTVFPSPPPGNAPPTQSASNSLVPPQPLYYLSVPPPPPLQVPQCFTVGQQQQQLFHPGIHETVGPMIVGGRLRHGGNAHVELKPVCKYFSYRDGEALKSYAAQNGPKDQLLPLFVQMFPSEHKDHVAAIFEKVMLLICGPGAGNVVGIEPRSDTSFIAYVRTGVVWHVIYNLRYRVLMDRHGFWYAENLQQYALMKEYCEGVRALPQHARHAKTDGMPSMPLVLELSRTMSRTSITAPPAQAPFDIQMTGSSTIC